MGAYAPLDWTPPDPSTTLWSVSRSGSSTSCAAAARHLPACSTSGWLGDAGPKRSSSTAASATPRPRSCSRCCAASRIVAALRPLVSYATHATPTWAAGASVTGVVAAEGDPAPPRRRTISSGPRRRRRSRASTLPRWHGAGREGRFVRTAAASSVTAVGSDPAQAVHGHMTRSNVSRSTDRTIERTSPARPSTATIATPTGGLS